MTYLYNRLGKGIFAIIAATILLLEIRSARCNQLQFFHSHTWKLHPSA